uniref:Protein kinase domain-containing protein n=1 Tax=Physcomitrium patens TaxID=3218 RepID=A0A7I4C1P7_PHYPA
MGDCGENLEELIQSVEDQIRRVEQKIDRVEVQIDGCRDDEERKQLRHKIALLRNKGAQLRDKEARLRDEKAQLWEQFLQDSIDHSAELLEGLLLPPVIELPQDGVGLARVLFPSWHGEQHGQLPVVNKTYFRIKNRFPKFAEEFLRVTDVSTLSMSLSSTLEEATIAPKSEMDVSYTVQVYLRRFFNACNEYSLDGSTLDLTFNKSEKLSLSKSNATLSRRRPDTLGEMFQCTFLVGEDELSDLLEAENDISLKMQPLNPRFYGDLRFILGYIAAGTKFQWVFIGKDMSLVRIEPLLDLAKIPNRILLILSIFNAFTLVRKMAEKIPPLPGRHAMFSSLVQGDCTIYFLNDSVRKMIKNFKSYCEATATDFNVVNRAYNDVKGSPYLPMVIEEPELGRGGDSYKVTIGPLGYSPRIRSEEDTKMLAKSVCNALKVLHEKGFVHRDVRLPNIVEITHGQFMLIDLETVAESPFFVHPSFHYLTDWSRDMLENSHYTPKSDMYQLGKLLGDKFTTFTRSPSARQFISRLMSKQVDANTALEDPWLKVDEEMSGLSSIISYI